MWELQAQLICHNALAEAMAGPQRLPEASLVCVLVLSKLFIGCSSHLAYLGSIHWTMPSSQTISQQYCCDIGGDCVFPQQPMSAAHLHRYSTRSWSCVGVTSAVCVLHRGRNSHKQRWLGYRQTDCLRELYFMLTSSFWLCACTLHLYGSLTMSYR